MNILKNYRNLVIGFFERKNSHFVFYFFAFLLMTFSTKVAYSNSLVAVVDTPVTIRYDDEKVSFISTQNTIEGAIRQSRISFGKYDITEPDLGTLLVGKKIDIKVIRALPVLISDNNQEHIAYSAYSEPSEILDQLGIEYYPEDKISTELILDPANYNAAGQLLTIERSPVYRVNVDGETKIVRSWAKTIGEVLKGSGISLGQRDIISPSAEEGSYGVLEINVTRVNTVDVWEESIIPFNVTTQSDYNLYVGQTQVTREGANGSKKELVHIVYHNGIEVERSVISSEILSSPITKIVVKGVKPYNAGMWWDTIVAAGNMYGIDPLKMYKVMICESHGNPYAGTYYKGLFQYSASTWAGASSQYPGGKYAGVAITDGTAQIYVTAWKVSIQGWGAWPTCGYM